MTLDQAPSRSHVFVDSNILVYHFQPHPSFGPICHRFLELALRQAHGLTHLASHDAHSDNVSAITRYAPQ